MNKQLLYLLTVFFLLAVPMAGLSKQAEAAEESPARPTTDKGKVELAHKLLGEPGKKPDVIALIKDVGFQKFLEPVMDDEAALLEVLDKLVGGATPSEESVVLADIHTYLLKDKRPAVRDRAIEGVQRLALYTDKPVVSDRLFALYENAGDDADLRAKIAPAFMANGVPDPGGKELRPFGLADYDKTLERVPTLFKDADWRVRYAAVQKLPRSMDAMHKSGIGVLEKDRDGRVRAAVIDLYRETRIKTQPAREMAMRGFEGKQIEELVSAIAYCSTMKMDEARGPMYAWLKRNAGELDDTKPTTFQIRQLKRRVIDTTVALRWKEAIDPDLFWLVEHEADWRARAQAAYAVLTLSGVKTLQFGRTERVFPGNMVEAEYTAMITAFKAWHLRHYEGQGDSPEVRDLEEQAQLAFAEHIYEIAEQRLLESDVANKKRGLELVMAIGPGDFAKEIGTLERLRTICASLEIFPTRLQEDIEANRMVARLVLGFLEVVDDVNVKKGALELVHGLAEFCERDEAMMAVSAVMQNAADDELIGAAKKVMEVIGERGYDNEEMQERQRYKEDEPDEE